MDGRRQRIVRWHSARRDGVSLRSVPLARQARRCPALPPWHLLTHDGHRDARRSCSPRNAQQSGHQVRLDPSANQRELLVRQAHRVPRGLQLPAQDYEGPSHRSPVRPLSMPQVALGRGRTDRRLGHYDHTRPLQRDLRAQVQPTRPQLANTWN